MILSHLFLKTNYMVEKYFVHVSNNYVILNGCHRIWIMRIASFSLTIQCLSNCRHKNVFMMPSDHQQVFKLTHIVDSTPISGHADKDLVTIMYCVSAISYNRSTNHITVFSCHQSLRSICYHSFAPLL